MKPLTFTKYFFLGISLLVGIQDSYSQDFSKEVSGELLHDISDDFEGGKSGNELYIKDLKTGKARRLNIKGKIPQKLLEAPSGSRVILRGAKRQQERVEMSFSDSGEISSDQMELFTTPAGAIKGTRKLLGVRVEFNDDTPICTGEEAIHRMLFDTSNIYSLKNFVRKNSQNLLDLNGEVTTVKINYNSADVDNCSNHYNNWAKLANEQLTNAGYNVSSFNHIMYFLPKNYSCSWAGLGRLNGQPTWIRSCSSHVIAHELGHNFGLKHASDTKYEYGDGSCSMGNDSNVEFNAPHKHQIGWLPVEKTVDITSNGTYRISLASLESAQTAYPQIYRIRKDSNSFYYLSYRRQGVRATFSNSIDKVSIYTS